MRKAFVWQPYRRTQDGASLRLGWPVIRFSEEAAWVEAELGMTAGAVGGCILSYPLLGRGFSGMEIVGQPKLVAKVGKVMDSPEDILLAKTRARGTA